MKVCKQCGRELEDCSFRKTKSRSKGIYNTTQGTSTLCRDCEALNSRAHQLLKKKDMGLPYNQESFNRLVAHYSLLKQSGRPIVSAAARRLIGAEQPISCHETNPLLRESELLEHISKIRNRLYTSFDEADAVHRELVDKLKAAGLYEEASNLLDEWFEEE